MIERIIFALAISLFVALRGYKKRSLSIDGAITAFFIGLVHGYSSYTFTAVLAAFFFSSSTLTKFQQDKKHKIEADWKEGGQRNYIQVLANSLTATVLCGVYISKSFIQQPIDFEQNPITSWIICAFIGHYSCCNGDTWASEIGILSKNLPRLITTGKPVPKGTNGGVSLLGTGACVAGGLFIGIVFYLISLFTVEGSGYPPQYPVIALGLFGGSFGSMADSLLGATLQYSALDPVTGKVVSEPIPNAKHITGVNILDNHMVNFLSALITTIVSGFVGMILF